MRKSVFFFAALALAAALVLATGSQARASTNDVCRFRSTNLMTYDGQAGHSLELWWRRDTNQILHQKGRLTKWTNPSGGAVLGPYPASPGSVTGSDGLTGAAAVIAQFTILLDSGVPGLPIVLTGQLANGGFYTGAPFVFSAVYSGTNQVWFSGYGTVTCGYSFLVPL
jgi:hypothetical protein